MSIGLGSNFKIYDEQFFGGMTEVLMQNANVFNEASANAIQLVPQEIKGNFERESFFTQITGLVSRRDVTSVASATDTAMTQNEEVGVKINRKIGPVANTLDSWRKIAQDPEEMSFILGQQIGKAVTLDYVNTIVKALVAALGNVTSTNAYDYSGTGTMTHNVLAAGLAKMGDYANNIVAFVMHSKVYFDLLGQSITDKVINVADVSIREGTVATLGRPTLVTDAADLVVSGTPNKYYTLALVANAAQVKESEEKEIMGFPISGLEQLVYRIQGEFAYNMNIKGQAWDSTNGGVNPADATIATAANWLQVATDSRALAGVRIKTQ